MNDTFIFIIALLSTLILTVLSERFLIPFLRSVKMQQKILDIGPRWHKSKEGTPTMGGLGFIASTFVVFVGFGIYMTLSDPSVSVWRLFGAYGYSLLCGGIGVIDDYAKFFKKQNEGLKAWQKYLLQLVVSALFLLVLVSKGGLNTELHIPFTSVYVDLGWSYYVLALILLTGIMNSVNLTDGIDGLASSVTAVVGAFFAVVSFALGSAETKLLSAVVIGACLGFLVYNFYPARVFMGDTGSLFLGGAVIAMAFLINDPLIAVIAGIVYVCESASVILQVGYFKLTHGKRLFKMSPIHHHFEKCGWSEIRIVTVFSLVTLIFSVVAWFGVRI